MNLNDLTPSGGGSLHGPVTRAAEPVATFTLTRAMHPDEIWNPRGSETAPPGRPLRHTRYAEESERSRPAGHMGETPSAGNLVRDTSRTVRAALRSGHAG